MGVVSPIGNDVNSMWESMMQGKSGAAEITHFDTTLFRTHFACEVKDFDSSFLNPKDARRLDPFVQFALSAAKQALEDSALDMEQEDPYKIGCIIGSGMGGLQSHDQALIEYTKGDGTPRFSPFLLPAVISNIAAGQVAITHKLRGVNYSTASACATSANAVANAFNHIRLGKADAIITGGSEAAIEMMGIGCFNSMHALSTRNDSPQTASRPYSKSRDGFVLGEGAACLMLEELEHAQKRGAKIYAEIVGEGMTSDAYHITAPDPEGNGAVKVMQLAIEDAGITINNIDYINTHGTSTPLGDIAEITAIEKLFGEHAYELNISSTKSMTGHLLGATGALEVIATALAIRNQTVPPTINHADDDVDETFDPRLNFTFNKPQKRVINYAISNAFGFGGHNVCIALKKFE